MSDNPFPEPDPDPLVKTTEKTVRLALCPKCKRPIGGDRSDTGLLCDRCFALMVNEVGVPLVDTEAKPIRLVFNRRAPASLVIQNESNLAPCIEDAIQDAARDIGNQLREAFLAGDATAYHMLAQAKVHGLLLMVVVQAAMLPPPLPDMKRKG